MGAVRAAAGEALGDAQRWTPNWPAVGHPGPIASAALYAGQSVGAVTRVQPAADIVRELAEGAEALLERSASR